MYRIYEQKRLPEQDDLLDEVASFQRGITLLQRIQRDDPTLWDTIVKLPDGIRSALAVQPRPARRRGPGELPGQLRRSRGTAAPDHPAPGGRHPLASRGAAPGETRRPAEAWRPSADVRGRRAAPHPPDHPGQLVQAVECEPDTARAGLPDDTNARVMAAYDAARRDARARLGRARRPTSDTRLRRYLSRALRLRPRCCQRRSGRAAAHRHPPADLPGPSAAQRPPGSRRGPPHAD